MDSEVLATANELITVKAQIKQLKMAENQLKEQLKDHLKQNGSIDLEAGRVYYIESKGSRTFSRSEVLEYIRDAYGEELADQIDHDCTKQGEPRQTVYVKLAGEIEEVIENE
ncbi:hypothetical protein ACV0LO_003272 [Vibrio cholerae]